MLQYNDARKHNLKYLIEHELNICNLIYERISGSPLLNALAQKEGVNT